MQLTWPNYEVAPEDSVHALGVVSINYARFERTHVWVLAAVANMKEEQASIINARNNPAARIELIRTFMARREWPEAAAEASALPKGHDYPQSKQKRAYPLKRDPRYGQQNCVLLHYEAG